MDDTKQDDFGIGGQDGGGNGTAPKLPVSLPIPPAIDVSMEALREAAQMQNAGPAPSDPLEQQVQAMHTRFAAVEETVGNAQRLAGAALETARDMTSPDHINALSERLSMLEKLVDDALTFYAKLRAHFGHKV